MDRVDGVDRATVTAAPDTRPDVQRRAERTYWDLDSDGFVSDDERDEDADGLNNYYEVSGGPMSPEFWEACYTDEAPYPIKYPGTKPYDADSDGDGILDGADDQDFDDVPNIMELSRNMAGDRSRSRPPAAIPALRRSTPQPAKALRQPVQPVPAGHSYSRTCLRHPVDRRQVSRRSIRSGSRTILN